MPVCLRRSAEDWLPICEEDPESIQEQADPINDPITVPMLPNLLMVPQDVLHLIKVLPKVFRESWTVLRMDSRRRVEGD